MKRTNKGAKRRLLLLLSIFIFLVCYMSYTAVSYWKQIFNNKHKTSELTKKYDNLLSDKEILESDVIKLQNPEYVAKYAREKYLYTKDGELIIKIIEEK